jgi:hypothetical protein
MVNGFRHTLKLCLCAHHISRIFCDNKSPLNDGVANASWRGSDVVVLSDNLIVGAVTSISDQTVSNLKVCTMATFIETQKGPNIGISIKLPHRGSGRTIYAARQLSHVETIVDAIPRIFGGSQFLETCKNLVICNLLKQVSYNKCSKILLKNLEEKKFVQRTDYIRLYHLKDTKEVSKVIVHNTKVCHILK